MMNLTITQDNLYLLIPSKMAWLASMLAEDENISIDIGELTPYLFGRVFINEIV